MRTTVWGACSLLLAAMGASALRADEGMWLYNQFPKAEVQKKYGFEVTGPFLDHLRLSSLRMGASASFVSPHGLIFTNHHVASGCVQKLSSAGHNYMANGFYAATGQEEMKCPDLEANELVRMEDVTARVNAGIQAKPGTADANRQRKAVLAAIEKECAAKTGRRCEVVTLYSGALYHLYEYRKYTDIRLVFAPEEDIAFFGGDPDNFTYPRYDLDIAFLRAYENGRPARTPQFLTWSREGAKEGELAFVSGNPASTDRFIPVSEFEYLRDTNYPLALGYLETVIRTLKDYGAKSAENHRIARQKLFSAENSYKARTWEMRGLRDPGLLAAKRRKEGELRAAIEGNPKLRAEVGGAWGEMEAAWREWAPHEKEFQILEGGPRYSDLFRIARDVLRLSEERAKPNGERLREYTDAALPSLELRMYSPAPIHDAEEAVVLANYFRWMKQQLGGADPAVKAVLEGRGPEEAARAYVGATRLQDVSVRKRLAAGGSAMESSRDGMIRLARLLDRPARSVRRLYEDRVVSVETASAARIARARFAIGGTREYPDATFTLRLSFGPVKGYTNQAGQRVAWATDFAGMYRHATGQEPFKLPERWLAARRALDLKTPLNFVTTADIIGGNSGSPTVNTRGEIIGIIFDSNLEAMANRFLYTEKQARAVHVASQGIIEALEKVYHADRLVKELGR